MRVSRAPFAQWENELPSMSLGIMHYALERFGSKSDLLYSKLSESGWIT